MKQEKPLIATREVLEQVYAVLGLPFHDQGLTSVQIVLRAGEPVSLIEARNGIITVEVSDPVEIGRAHV